MEAIGLRRGTVAISPYLPDWVAAFDAERALLLSLLSGLLEEIEHVGSTAIPGMSSKPVIDMLIGLHSFDLVGEAVTRLVDAGYTDRGQETSGRHLVVKGPEERRTHYLHLVAHGSGEWIDMLLFRDYLRVDENRAQQYENLKRELGGKYAADRAAYAAEKEPFVVETLLLAKRASEDGRAG